MQKPAFLLSVLLPVVGFAQTPASTVPAGTTASSSGQESARPVPVKASDPSPVDNLGAAKLNSPSNRVSFIVGPGASYITRQLYDDPVVNQTNDLVMIDKAKSIKTNLALGIIYTPAIYTIPRDVPYIDINGKAQSRTEIEVVPKGSTFALFLNPVALSKATETQPFFSMIDFGIGYGYRFAGGLVLLATTEFFSIRQPRQSFIDEYQGKGKSYTIGGAVQKSIDVNDNTIFTTVPVITFGFKACYSFDIIKNYMAGSKSFGPAEAPTGR